jgi:hypothetical protein
MGVWSPSPVDGHKRVDKDELKARIENSLVRTDCQLPHTPSPHTEF